MTDSTGTRQMPPAIESKARHFAQRRIRVGVLRELHDIVGKTIALHERDELEDIKKAQKSQRDLLRHQATLSRWWADAVVDDALSKNIRWIRSSGYESSDVVTLLTFLDSVTRAFGNQMSNVLKDTKHRDPLGIPLKMMSNQLYIDLAGQQNTVIKTFLASFDGDAYGHEDKEEDTSEGVADLLRQLSLTGGGGGGGGRERGSVRALSAHSVGAASVAYTAGGEVKTRHALVRTHSATSVVAPPPPSSSRVALTDVQPLYTLAFALSRNAHKQLPDGIRAAGFLLGRERWDDTKGMMSWDVHIALPFDDDDDLLFDNLSRTCKGNDIAIIGHWAYPSVIEREAKTHARHLRLQVAHMSVNRYKRFARIDDFNSSNVNKTALFAVTDTQGPAAVISYYDVESQTGAITSKLPDADMSQVSTLEPMVVQAMNEQVTRYGDLAVGLSRAPGNQTFVYCRETKQYRCNVTFPSQIDLGLAMRYIDYGADKKTIVGREIAWVGYDHRFAATYISPPSTSVGMDFGAALAMASVAAVVPHARFARMLEFQLAAAIIAHVAGRKGARITHETRTKPDKTTHEMLYVSDFGPSPAKRAFGIQLMGDEHAVVYIDANGTQIPLDDLRHGREFIYPLEWLLQALTTESDQSWITNANALRNALEFVSSDSLGESKGMRAKFEFLPIFGTPGTVKVRLWTFTITIGDKIINLQPPAKSQEWRGGAQWLIRHDEQLITATKAVNDAIANLRFDDTDHAAFVRGMRAVADEVNKSQYGLVKKLGVKIVERVAPSLLS